MFRSVFTRKLRDPATRKRVVKEALEQTRRDYASLPLEQARETLIRLQAQYDELGIDRLELLYAAESELPGDHYWLRQIVDILLRREQVTPEQAPYLLRLAVIEPHNLELWHRIFREGRLLESEDFYWKAREQCATAFLHFFGKESQRGWPEPNREEAYELLIASLEETLARLIALNRRDGSAAELFRAGMHFIPARKEIRQHYARIAVDEEYEPTPETLSVVMEQLVDNPGDASMILWTANGLLKIPRHFDEGLAMLRQLYEDQRDDRTYRAYLSAIKLADEITADDFPFLAGYVSKHPGDIRALELLADYYVKTEDESDEALRVYRSAAAHSPKRRNYLRLLGRASASRSEWSRVIEIFDEIRGEGNETEDILIPLATAYAEFERNDESAQQIYRKAIDLGTRKPEIHDIYCRHLYLNARQEPESAAQFIQSARLFPQCKWAQLGVVSHYLETGDGARALDGALNLLAENPNDIEAARLAARALALDFSRRQLAKLANVEPRPLGAIFEEAHKAAPDAGPIALGLARRRVADGVRDAETAKLLGDVCRKNPDVIDLRIARADILWELDQKSNAATLYRELIERWRASGSYRLPRTVTPDARRQILLRLAEWLVSPPGPTRNDLDILIEAIGERDVPAELFLAAARALVTLGADHPRKMAILRQAQQFAPNDMRLRRAIAEGEAAGGNPRPAIELAASLIKEGKTGEETSNLLRSVCAVASSSTLDETLVGLLRDAIDPAEHPQPLLLALAELIDISGTCAPGDLQLTERLHELLPRNVRVSRWYAQCLTKSGQDAKAAKVYDTLVDDGRQDDAVVLELARTNARLGRTDRRQHRLAQQAVGLEPNDPDLLFYLASIELELRNITVATRLLDKVLELSSEMHPRVYALLENDRQVRTEHGELFLLLARVHVKAGRIEQAMMVLNNLQSEYQRYLGDLISVYTEIIHAAPENPRPRVERAILNRLSGRIDEALADMKAAHELAPDNTDILSEYVEILRAKVSPSGGKINVDLALQCAGIYIELGDDLNAYEMVELSLEEQPENDKALLLLARLQLNAGALPNAFSSIKRVGGKKATLGILKELANTLAEQEDYNMAAEVLTYTVEIGGPQRELLEQLRALYQDQARSDEVAPQRQRVMSTLSEEARGRYELREQIGTGAMGEVFKAYDRELDEVVVLKILPEHFAKNPDALQRFRNEAKAARKLAHPHICRIHDIGKVGGRRHISMEYVGGGDLRDFIQAHNGHVPLAAALRVTREIAEALGHAHSEGVLHRDIKAANIMLTSAGRVKLSDFGIAALQEVAGVASIHHSSPTVIGTPLYMSPEQFDGKNLTAASDIYSLGVLFYEMLSGKPPFTRGSIPYHHRFSLPPRIQGLADPVWVIVEKTLRKDPKERYQTASDLVRDIRAIEEDIEEMEDTRER